MITPRTTGIIGVHLWGRPCNIEALTTIANKYNLKLLFDAAHAFGCSYKGHMIGNFGNAEVFSFHATKFFNTLEGGAIVTNDDIFANKVRLMKNFGFSGYDHVIYLGTNGKMHEVSASMGLSNFDNIDEFITTNFCNFKLYKNELENIPGVRLSLYDDKEKYNYQYIILEIDKSITDITRDQLMKILWAENILVRRYFYPGCHRMEPYRSYFPNAGLLLQETERVSDQVLLLPTGMTITPEDIRLICHIIRFSLKQGCKLKFTI